jgi:hypothetical protein
MFGEQAAGLEIISRKARSTFIDSVFRNNAK